MAAVKRLRRATRDDDVSAAECLISDFPDAIAGADPSGRSALFHAAKRGSVAVARLLLRSRANLNATCGCGETPLDAACYWAERHGLPGGDAPRAERCRSVASLLVAAAWPPSWLAAATALVASDPIQRKWRGLPTRPSAGSRRRSGSRGPPGRVGGKAAASCQTGAAGDPALPRPPDLCDGTLRGEAQGAAGLPTGPAGVQVIEPPLRCEALDPEADELRFVGLSSFRGLPFAEDSALQPSLQVVREDLAASAVKAEPLEAAEAANRVAGTTQAELPAGAVLEALDERRVCLRPCDEPASPTGITSASPPRPHETSLLALSAGEAMAAAKRLAVKRLRKAARDDDVSAAKRLLSDSPEAIADVDGGGRSALFHAAERGSVAVARLLLLSRANVNATRRCGETPLDAACYWAERRSRPSGDATRAARCRRVASLLVAAKWPPTWLQVAALLVASDPIQRKRRSRLARLRAGSRWPGHSRSPPRHPGGVGAASCRAGAASEPALPGPSGLCDGMLGQEDRERRLCATGMPAGAQEDRVEPSLRGGVLGEGLPKADEPCFLGLSSFRGIPFAEDSILQAVRKDLATSAAKAEPREAEAEAAAKRGGGPRSLDSQQVQFLRHLMRGASDFDPAMNPQAWQQWRHLARPVNVDDLLQTHSCVSPTFAHGRHRGQSVEDLVGKLLRGEASVKDITPLVVVRCMGQLWVVFGNRRLKALRQYRARLGRAVRVQCIVHDIDGRTAYPPCLVAKFLLASTTTNGGAHADFRAVLRGDRRRG